jgi:cobalt-zinc-cadmium efflux system membrane fusion protein
MIRHPKLAVLALFAGPLCLLACSEAPPPQTEKDKQTALSLSAASHKFIEIAPAGAGSNGLGGVLPGRVAFRPQGLAAVGSPISARVLNIHVRPGEAVKAGTVLLTLQGADAAAMRAAYDQANAKASAAEEMLRRQGEMLAKGVGLEMERFESEMRAREARAELERARRGIELIGSGKGDLFYLKAPADGVVLSIRPSVGTVVAPEAEALITIGDPRKLWIVAEVAETEVGGVSKGQIAEVRVPGADLRFDAVIDGLGQVVDGEQRRLPVYLTPRAVLENRTLSPGMLAEVRIQGSHNQDILSLPATAVLIKDGSRRIVYIQREDGRFEPREVRTGVSRDGRVTILEGLKPGEKVVIRGALLLDSEAEQLL